MAYQPNNGGNDDGSLIPPLTPDWKQAEEFLEALAGPGWKEEIFVWQSIDDDKDRQSLVKLSQGENRGKSSINRTNCGTFSARLPWLTTMIGQGAGIFVTVNKTDGMGRKAENIREIRCIWCEWDGPGEPPAAWPLEPHITVESSPGKYHFYWLTEPLETAAFGRLMSAMIALGSDPNAKDTTRVLRLPGTFHRKKDARKGLDGTPWQVALRHVEDRERYTVAELMEAFGPFEPQVQPQVPKPPPKPRKKDYNAREIQSALAAIHDADDRETWLKIGMALHSTGLPDARMLWDDWSRQSDKYDPAGQQTAWESFRQRDGGVGIGTLYNLAVAHGWKKVKEELLLDRFGNPISCALNAVIWLRQSGRKFALNEFSKTQTIDGAPMSDDAVISLLIETQAKHRVNLRKEHLTDGIARLCHENSFHPVRDYLDGLQWDGVNRLDGFIERVFGPQDQPYSDVFGRCWLISGVARIYEPGCQVHYSLLIISTEQGTGKSTFGRALVPDKSWFTDDVGGDLHQREAETGLFGKWVIEFAEGMRGDRAGKDTWRAFLTRDTGHTTLKWEKFASDFPRQCIFYTSTNNPTPLDGFDEERRQWPVSASNGVDNAYVREYRDQLWAEAVARYKSGEPWWIGSDLIKRIKAHVQFRYEHVDAMLDVIAGYCNTHVGPIFIGNMMVDLKIAVDKSKAIQMKIATCLKHLGWTKGEKIKKGADRDKTPWLPPDEKLGPP